MNKYINLTKLAKVGTDRCIVVLNEEDKLVFVRRSRDEPRLPHGTHDVHTPDM